MVTTHPVGPTRRQVLAGLGGAIGLGLMAGPARALAAAPDPAVPMQEIWEWNQWLAQVGPRPTGSDGHRTFIDWLADQWERTGLRVNRDRLTFDRWSPRRWELKVDGGEPADLAFYFPYSGQTPPAGIDAPMVYLGPSPVSNAAWGLARGKIAVVDVPTPALPIAVAFQPTGQYPADSPPPPTFDTQPAISDVAAAPVLSLAAQAGVRGVVCLRQGLSDALAADQYSPFTTGYQNCPAVWVKPSQAPAIRRAAIRGAGATLTLDAPLDRGAATETIWSILPGSDPREAVVINTHTDGPNAAEENGGLGLLALARELSKVPRSQRRRSVIFVATTGHFQIPQLAAPGPLNQSASRWIAMHPELLDGKQLRTVAALTIEHLGCTEWRDNDTHTEYQATGQPGVGYCYTSNPAMRQNYLDAARGTANTRTATILQTPVVSFGEGHDFYKKGIATASLIPTPSYLVAAPPDGALSKLDPNLIHGQIRTFANLFRRLETLTAAQIGPSLGL